MIVDVLAVNFFNGVLKFVESAIIFFESRENPAKKAVFPFIGVPFGRKGVMVQIMWWTLYVSLHKYAASIWKSPLSVISPWPN